MSRTSGQLMKSVAAFMNRDATAFTVASWDNLLDACNNARLHVERTIDFEYSRVQTQLTSVSLTNGASLGSVTLVGTSTPVSVKGIKRAFLALTNGGTVPVKIMDRDAYLDRIARRYQGAISTNPDQFAITSVPPAVAQIGTTLYVLPNDTTFWGSAAPTIYLDVFKWLPDYTSAGTENDFLLDVAFDYLKMAAVTELNFFLKEDQRVQISAAIMQNRLESLRAWNAAIVNQAVDVSLD